MRKYFAQRSEDHKLLPGQCVSISYFRSLHLQYLSWISANFGFYHLTLRRKHCFVFIIKHLKNILLILLLLLLSLLLSALCYCAEWLYLFTQTKVTRRHIHIEWLYLLCSENATKIKKKYIASPLDSVDY